MLLILTRLERSSVGPELENGRLGFIHFAVAHRSLYQAKRIVYIAEEGASPPTQVLKDNRGPGRHYPVTPHEIELGRTHLAAQVEWRRTRPLPTVIGDMVDNFAISQEELTGGGSITAEMVRESAEIVARTGHRVEPVVRAPQAAGRSLRHRPTVTVSTEITEADIHRATRRSVMFGDVHSGSVPIRISNEDIQRVTRDALVYGHGEVTAVAGRRFAVGERSSGGGGGSAPLIFNTEGAVWRHGVTYHTIGAGKTKAICCELGAATKAAKAPKRRVIWAD